MTMYFVGIDISKYKHDCCIISAANQKVVSPHNFRFIVLYLLFYHNSESVEIESFPGWFPTLWIYGAGGLLGVDLG